MFDKAVAAIKLARSKGFRVTVNCTLFSGENPDDVAAFFDEAMTLGIEGITVSPGYSYHHAPRQDVFLGRSASKRLFREIFKRGRRTGARLGGARTRWSFNHSGLFLDFLAGNQAYQCTPWSTPTYNLFGWQRPCYLLTDEGHASSFKSLMEDTAWDKYGVGRNPACDNCMAHCGFEGTAVNDAFSSSVQGAQGGLVGPAADGSDGARAARDCTATAIMSGAPSRRSPWRTSSARAGRGWRPPIEARGCHDACTGSGDVNSAAPAQGAGPAQPAKRDAFAAQLEEWRVRMEAALEARLPRADVVPTRLHEAMRYSVLGGGKRIRPALVFATARTVGLEERQVEAAACAIELIHVYSLVHDDLPAMDDDDLRRGRPTCHKAFDEATAVLVGDALQTLAFQVLARDPALPDRRPRACGWWICWREASGTFGMAGGQAIDLAVQGKRLDIAQVEEMHARKTGALIRVSIMMAAACAPALDARLYEALRAFADPIGLAFQIQDDLLDVLGDVSTLGKATGADSERGKPTHPAVIGIQASQERVRLLHAQALEALAPFGARAEPLRSLAGWLLARRYWARPARRTTGSRIGPWTTVSVGPHAIAW